MALSDDVLTIAYDVKPFMVTIVPEGRNELTTEGGLNVKYSFDNLKRAIAKFKDFGVGVSLFIEPEEEMIDLSVKVGADTVEFHTGLYSEQIETKKIDNELARLLLAAEYADKNGLLVNAGHGLNYDNVGRVLKMKNLHELNIGHSIISRSVFVGLENAINEMKNILQG